MKRTIIMNYRTYEHLHYTKLEGEEIKIIVYDHPDWYGDTRIYHCINEETKKLLFIAHGDIFDSPAGFLDREEKLKGEPALLEG